MTEIRRYWLDTLLKIVNPVLSNMANGKLKDTMPVEAKISDRESVTYLEALGRTLTGLAPWLEMPSDDPWEEDMRVRMASLARDAISNAVDSSSPDYCSFTDIQGGQPLVDAAFLAHGIIRAPRELWAELDERTQNNLVIAL